MKALPNMLIEQKDNNGNITLKVIIEKIDGSKSSIFIASKYDVYKEARDFAFSHCEKLKEVNILYGLGLGYHVKELIKLMTPDQRLIIFDIRDDIYDYGKSRDLYLEIEEYPNVIVEIFNDEAKLLNSLRGYLNSNTYFMIHNTSVKLLLNKYENLKFVLEKFQLTKKYSNDANLQNKLADNQIKNNQLKDLNANIFFNKFIGIPGIVVSAGPSLEFSLSQLRKINENAFIFAVGRSLSSLINNGIRPHMFCIIEADDLAYLQIKDFEFADIPFIYLSTASNSTVISYNGPRFITYNSSDNADNIDTGGSVATAAFDLLIKFGCDPIIFVGQDLAYVDNQTHYNEAKIYDIPIDVKEMKNMRKVKGVNGKFLNTDLGLLSFKKWFENKIRLNKNVFINSSFGAEIEGTIHMTIEEASKKHMNQNFDINKKIKMIINDNK